MSTSIGSHIKKLRELKNYTQQYMASRLNITVTAYGNIERGEVEITLRRLREIAHILGLHYTQIVDFDVDRLMSGKPAGTKTANEEDLSRLLQMVNMVREEHIKIIRLLDKYFNNGMGKLQIGLLFLLQFFQPDILLPLIPECI